MESLSSYVAIAAREPANSAIQIGLPDDESMLSECDTSMHDDTDIEDDTHSDDVISEQGHTTSCLMIDLMQSAFQHH